MNRSRLIALLFITILTEGYVVLASELIAIRQSLPFVGSGTEVVSVIISAILMPLAFGYAHGGRAYGSSRGNGRFLSLRKRLVRNFSIAALILSLGLSFLFIESFYELLPRIGITHRVLQVALYSLLFLVYPTFLLGQTVPLITNYFKKHRFSEAAGKILFFSTAGSFLGATLSTLVLMATIGVGQTVIVTIALLTLLTLLLRPKRKRMFSTLALIAFAIAAGLNNPSALRSSGIIADNTYNTIRIHDIPQEQSRILELNRTGAAKYADNDEFLFPYQYYIEKNIIEPLGMDDTPKEVLVLGAGGFIAGMNDGYNHFTFVDIDKELKPISEQELQQKPLSPNKQFEAEEARGFLVDNHHKYDLIILDVYSNIHAMPAHMVTREFLAEIKQHLKEDGVLAANIVTTANFLEPFSVTFDNTFRSVFNHYTRQVVQDYSPWQAEEGKYQNVLYVYYNREYGDDVYTDDRNRLFLDRAFDFGQPAASFH